MKKTIKRILLILGVSSVLTSCKKEEIYSWWTGVAERSNIDNVTKPLSKGVKIGNTHEYESYTYSEDFDNPYGMIVCNLKHTYTGPNSSKQEYDLNLVRKGNKLYLCKDDPSEYLYYKDEKGENKKKKNDVWKNKSLSYETEPMYIVERYTSDKGDILEMTLYYGPEGDKTKGLTTIIFELKGETEAFKEIEQYKTYWRR